MTREELIKLLEGGALTQQAWDAMVAGQRAEAITTLVTIAVGWALLLASAWLTYRSMRIGDGLTRDGNRMLAENYYTAHGVLFVVSLLAFAYVLVATVAFAPGAVAAVVAPEYAVVHLLTGLVK